MDRKVKNMILAAVAGLSVTTTAVLYAGGNARRSRMECTGVRVAVLDSAANRFVDRNDVRRILDANCGSLVGVLADSARLAEVERILESKSVIRECQAYFTGDGFLNIDISQRTPVVRFQDQSNGWYADADGYVFPLQRSYTSMVPVVDGDFPVKVERGFKGPVEDRRQREWLMRVVGMVEHMESNGWGRRISQIHVSRNGEVMLVPAEGAERFVFGQPVKVEEKFTKMEKYYRVIRRPEKKYREVDLRFDGQIVCR